MSYLESSDRMTRRIFFGENLPMIVLVEAKEGVIVPEHSHDNADQFTVMLEGELMLVAGGEKHNLTKEVVFMIPRNVTHSGKGLKDCRYVDYYTASPKLFNIKE